MTAPSGSFGDLSQLDTASQAQVSYDVAGAVITTPSQIAYETARVQPPSSLYVGLNDFLVVEFTSPEQTAQIEVTGRLLEPDGSVKVFDVPIQVTAPVSGGQVTITLTEGFLLNVALISRMTTFQRGKIWVTVSLQRGLQLINPTFLQALISEYVWTGSIMQWPGSPLRSPTEGPGSLEVLKTTVGAGVDWSLLIPAQVRARVYSIRANLIADAVAGNRTVTFSINDSAPSTVYRANPPAAQLANQNFGYTFAPAQQRAVAATDEVANSIPDPTFLGPNMNVKVVTSGLDVGDQWTGIEMLVEKWVQL